MINFVHPIAVKQMRKAAPAVARLLRRVVAGVVMAGNIDRRAVGNVAVILRLVRFIVICEVVEDVERPLSLIHI